MEHPLWYAIFIGCLDDTRRLLLQGVNANARGMYGQTALHYATRNRNEAMVLLLLEAGVYPNCVNNIGDTPLILNAFCGNVQVLRVLLEAGADHSSKNDRGDTALDMATLKNSQPCIDLLTAHAALNPPLAPLYPPPPSNPTIKRDKIMVRPTPLDMRRFCPVRDLHPMMWQHLSDLDREMIRCAQNSSRELPVVDQAFARTCIKEGNVGMLEMVLKW